MKRVFLSLVMFIFAGSIIFAKDVQVITEDWAPYNYEKNSKVVGFGTEVVEETLKEAGVSYDIGLYPWARAYQMVQNNPNTLIYTISRTEERENMFEWVGPFAPRTMYLFKLKSKKEIAVKNLDDLKKYKIGVVKSDAMEGFFKEKGFNETQLDDVVSEDLNIKKLFIGRVDFITGSELALSYKMKELNFNYGDLEKTLLLVDSGGYYMALNKKTPKEIVDKIKTAFEKLKKNGKIEEISKKYLK